MRATGAISADPGAGTTIEGYRTTELPDTVVRFKSNADEETSHDDLHRQTTSSASTRIPDRARLDPHARSRAVADRLSWKTVISGFLDLRLNQLHPCASAVAGARESLSSRDRRCRSSQRQI